MRSHLLAFILFLSVTVSAQTDHDYIQKFENISDENEYSTWMDSVVRLQYADRISFKPEEFKELLEITQKKEFAAKVLPRLYGWMAGMYGNGKLDQTILYFLESASRFEQEGRKLEQALVCFQIGLVQHKAKNFEEAREYYLKTLAIGKELVDARTIIGCYNGLGLIFREEKKYPEAIDMFKKAAVVADDNHDIAWHGILEGNLGSIFRSQEKYDSSLYHFFQDLKYIRQTTEIENEVETYAELGRVFLNMRQYKNAKIYLDSSLLVLKNSGRVLTDFFNPTDFIYKSYAMLYAETGNYKMAYEYFQKYHKVEEQKAIAVKGSSLAQLQSTYTFKKKENDLDYLQKINEANETIISQQRYGQLALLFVILLLIGAALFVYNISRQRQKLNLELNISNSELERSNATKDKLFSVLSHDLRGPINNLRGVLELVKMGLLEKEQFNDLSARLDEQLEMTNDTLNNLLQWARTQISGSVLRREKIFLAEATARIIQQFDMDLKRKEIAIQNSISQELTILADREQYDIIIRNLIGNAIKFTHQHGSIVVTARSINNSVEITVEDNGTGMPSDELKNLFTPGRHFSKPGTNKEKGTGIGLVITKEMILNNNGDIRVESERGKGSKFIFTLPS